MRYQAGEHVCSFSRPVDVQKAETATVWENLLGSEERRTVYSTLELRVEALPDGSSDIGDASSGEDTTGTTEQAQVTITDGASPASLPPDPAFDPLLPTLREMTTALIMLPATLPPKLKSVAIGNDLDNQDSADTTSGDKYTILFLNPDAYPPPDLTQIVQPYAHYKVLGTLT